MKIAYFSPLNPARSGISDFSEELLAVLSQYITIDIFTCEKQIENKWIKDNLTVLNMEQYHDIKIREQYDKAIFHIGNNYSIHKEIVDMFMQYGGIVELHDVALHHLLAEQMLVKKRSFKDYIQIMTYCHGLKGKEIAEAYIQGKVKGPWENEPLTYTVNKHYIDKAEAVIVHSDFAKQMVKGINPDKFVQKIPLHSMNIIPDIPKSNRDSRNKLGITNNTFVLGAFGNMSIEKRILSILEALKMFKRIDNDFRFYIVGQVSISNIDKIVKRLGLENNVVITGYVETVQFDRYMAACDVVFNLRYPTQGESSASLHRLLGMGKNVIVTDVGTFQEYPDDIVMKIPYDKKEIESIYQTLKRYYENRGDVSIKKRIADYANENFAIEKNAKKYVKFLEDLIDNSVEEQDLMEDLLKNIVELGFNKTYIEYLGNTLWGDET